MQSKKIISLVLALAFIMGFTACKKDESDLARVKEAKKIIVGVTDFEPLDYQNEDGEWTGFDAELAEAFAKELGVKLKIQEIAWANKEKELAAFSIDLVWNGLTYDDERAENMSLSDPYMINRQALVTGAAAAELSTAEDFAGRQIAVESGSAGESVAEKAFPAAELIGKVSQIEALTELAMGTVDAVVIDGVMANYLINKPGSQFAALTVREDFTLGEEENYVVAARKGSNLTAELNSFLKKAKKDGLLEDLAEKYGLTSQLK